MTTSLLMNVVAMNPGAIGALAVIGVLLLIIVMSNVHVVPQAKAYVIERLGAYHTTF